jgi:hypothetical protein
MMETGIYPEPVKIDPLSFSSGVTVSISHRNTIKLTQDNEVILLTPHEVRLLFAMLPTKN